MTARDVQHAIKMGLVADCLATMVPALTVDDITAFLTQAKASKGRALGELARHLGDHPDAFVSGNPDCPKALIRLANLLIAAGYTQVVRPPCSRCGRVAKNLPARGPGGCMCANCASLKYLIECARCGRANVRTAARRPEGTICQVCYRTDPDVVEPCAVCGRVRLTVTRREDGSPLCQGCWTPPLHRCVLCGTEAQAVTVHGDGPVCRSCYERQRRPQRLCSRCGKIRPVSLRAIDDENEGDVCTNCNRGPEKTCTVCQRVRPCRQFGSNRDWTCASCRPRAADTCIRCGRFRAVQARWPMGPVCNTCYAVVLDSPQAYSHCRDFAPLLGRDHDGRPTCGPCSGLAAHLCRRCGRAGRRYENEICARCTLRERLAAMLMVDGRVPDQLVTVYEALCDVANPRSLLLWASRSPNAKLLIDLAASGEPITHEVLDRLPPSRYELYVRQMLVHTGVLPARDDDTERIPAWLEQRLAGRPAVDANLLRPFVHWHLLRRARRRNLQRRFPASSRKHLRTRILVALDLLDWLAERHLDVADLTQPDLEVWLAAGGVHRLDIRYFLNWLHSRGLAAKLHVPLRRGGDPVVLMDEDQRWALLRTCLADETMPIDVRAAGALVLLYGMTVYRVRSLTADHLSRRGDQPCLKIGHQPVPLPPRLARLLERVQSEQPKQSRLGKVLPGAQWLFPGLNPGMPVHSSHLESKLLQHGIPSKSARSAALIGLAADLPSPVLADLFGLHISTAVRWARLSKRDWTAFVAGRTTDLA